MVISRRSFFGSAFGVLAGLFGYNQVVKSENPSGEKLMKAFKNGKPGKWTDPNHMQKRGAYWYCCKLKVTDVNGVEVEKSHPLMKLLENPNLEDYFGDLLYKWNSQMELTGLALTWMVANEFGIPMELHCVPTNTAFPQPKELPYYPDGFYQITPLYPYSLSVKHAIVKRIMAGVGIIPAKWMLKMRYPNPISRYDGYSPQTAFEIENDMGEYLASCGKYDRKRWNNAYRTCILESKLALFSKVLTRNLAPFFGENLKVEIIC